MTDTRPRSVKDLQSRVSDVLAKGFGECRHEGKLFYQVYTKGVYIGYVVGENPEFSAGALETLTPKQARAVAEALTLLEAGVHEPTREERAIEVLTAAGYLAHVHADGIRIVATGVWLKLCGGKYYYQSETPFNCSSGDLDAIAKALRVLNLNEGAA